MPKGTLISFANLGILEYISIRKILGNKYYNVKKKVNGVLTHLEKLRFHNPAHRLDPMKKIIYVNENKNNNSSTAI